MSVTRSPIVSIPLSFLRLWLASVVVATVVCADVSLLNATEPETVTYFLLRHAEKDRSNPSDDNPNLTPAGHERAGDLARLLKDIKIKHIHSTRFRRTQQTAAPIATQFNLPVMTYVAHSVADLQKLAHKMRSLQGPQIVVGHSDTTHKLVEILGGDPGAKIEDDEFDRLYVVTGRSDTKLDAIQLRYGAVSQ